MYRYEGASNGTLPSVFWFWSPLPDDPDKTSFLSKETRARFERSSQQPTALVADLVGVIKEFSEEHQRLGLGQDSLSDRGLCGSARS